MRLAVLCLTIILFAATATGAWREALDQLLTAEDGPGRERLMGEILDADPDWRDVAAALESITFPDVPGKGVPVLRTTVCTDSVERPWVVVVPPEYDPQVPTPLLVVLHGGVSWPEITDDPVGYVAEGEFAGLAIEMGWISLYPFGQEGATWWDDVGMTNIRDLVRTVKTEFNVDDDRVWMAGFSDGASAGFLHAMLAPNDYAAFVALNGHMGVGSLDGGLPTYAPNMANTPVYAVTTFEDELYPSERMRPTIDMARGSGADIFYRELDGEHDFTYADDELPRVARFLERHPRDPFPTRIVWESAGREFGLCRWFGIERVTTDEPAAWHTDANVGMVDDRVSIGFYPDEEFEGTGVSVASLAEGGEYPARSLGLLEGDIIVGAGGTSVDDIDDLNEFKSRVKRGDPIELTVLRDGAEVVLYGQIPEPRNYLLFKRDVPSAKARVTFSAGRIDVEASRLGAFRVLVHPDMIRLDRNLTIAVNGETVYEGTVEADVEFLLRNFLENRDRRLLYVGAVAVELD